MSPNHLSGSWRGVLLVALGFLPACGGNASGGAAGGTDAAPAVEDAGRPTADSTSPTTDAAPTPDATPTPDANSPDGAPPPTHDAAIPPAPDAAMPPPPDAATPPTPDAATPPAEIHVAINEIDCHGRDWVELYNLAETPAILDGYGLSDRPDDPTRAYLLPLDTVVPPGGFLAIRQSAGGAGFTFGIGCGGGDAVALLDPAGATVDTVTLPDLPDRDAWGRLPDGTGDWARTDPTRGAANVPGPLAGADYFNPEGRNVIEIQLPPASLDSLNAEPYVYQPGRIRIGNGTGNPTGWLDVGVHIKGRAGSFRPLTGKSALRIDLNRQVAGQTLDGLLNLTLNNMVQDPSCVHELATYTLYRAMGIPAPRVGYARVTVNGDLFGLYLFLETYDQVWLGDHFPTTAHLYEGLYGQDLYADYVDGLDAEEGDPLDRSDLWALIAALDAAQPGQLMPQTGALVDWDEVTKAMAIQLYIGDWDGYADTRNNWYMHFDDTGQVTLLPWGTDQTWSADLAIHQGDGRLFRACMADLDCRTLYDTQLQAVLNTWDTLDIAGLIQRVYAFQRPELDADPRKEWGIDTADAVLQQTLDFMAYRRQEIGDSVACLVQRVDPDGDGFICDQDCGPDDPNTYPGAPEICGDDIDQDCNGRADDGPDCPDCQAHFMGPHRYLVCPNVRNYDDAEAHCEANGARLAQIDGPLENATLWSWAMNTVGQWWWLGANDRDVEGEFRWSDGSPTHFTQFADGQPDNSNDEDCVHYFDFGPVWNDIACGAELGVLCEDTCAPGEDADGDGHLRCGDDCDDGDPNIHPGAPEICRDGVDQNCDGMPDDGLGCDCFERFMGPHRYLFCRNTRTWSDARAYCQAQGMDLVLVDTAAENAFVARNAADVAPRAWWLGHTDTDHEGDFTGWDGTHRYAGNWNGGEPNNAGGNENCAHLIDGSDLWNDIPCEVQLGVVCEELCPDGQDGDHDGVPRCGADCDDGDRGIRPGASEICGDGVDQDCDGVVDNGPRCL